MHKERRQVSIALPPKVRVGLKYNLTNSNLNEVVLCLNLVTFKFGQ